MGTVMKWIIGLYFVGTLPFPGSAGTQLKGVATIPDLGAIVRAVGGDRVRVQTIARGARLLVLNGLELEVGWLPRLIQGARNPRIRPEGPGVFSGASTVRVLEVPAGELSRTEGDIHPFGNPHITLDPRNGITIAKALAKKLLELDPAGKALYEKRAAEFTERLTGKTTNSKKGG